MDTLICAGGSGARVLEAVLHLCAAGLGPPKLRIFVIDPDGTNGNGQGTADLVNRYQALYRGLKTSSVPFFGTELDLLRAAGDSQGLQVFSPVNRHQAFRSVVNYEALTPEQKDVVHLLFTDGELDMKMAIGYQGHPALGAGALALLPLFHTSVPLLADFADALRNDVMTGTARVVIAGSVFGGTGASTIHPLVRYLRSEELLRANANRLKLGAVALAPYFKFFGTNDAASPAEVKKEAAKSEDFPLASRSAAEYYEHLRATDDWDFDAMYWVGDDSPQQVQYAPGGERQKNPAHFVDLLGALAAMDFFSNQPNDKGCSYAGPGVPDDTRHNLVTWNDLPLRGKLFDRDRAAIVAQLELFQMMLVAHLGFNSPVLSDPRLAKKRQYVPWYATRFAPGSLTEGESGETIRNLEDYWKHSYLPWWEQVHAADGRVRLLNMAVWRNGSAQTDRLNNLLWPDDKPHTLEPVDEFFSNMVAAAHEVPDEATPARRYLSLLTAASRRTLAAQLHPETR